MLKISAKKTEIINALPDEVKRQVVNSYQGVLSQQVYSLKEAKVISIWGMNLLEPDDYVTTAEINQVTGYAYVTNRKEWVIPEKQVQEVSQFDDTLP